MPQCICLYFFSLSIGKGYIKDAYIFNEKIKQIYEVYDYSFARNFYLFFKCLYYSSIGNYYKCIDECDEAIACSTQLGLEPTLISLFGTKALALINLNDIDGSKKFLDYGNKLIKSQAFVPPIYLTYYMRGRILYDIKLLEESINNNDKKYTENA